MELKEKIELIVNFMGVKEQSASYDNYGKQELVYFTRNDLFRTYSYSIPGLSTNAFIELSKYNSSYDWMMEVVEKIESLGYQFKICRKRIEIYDDQFFKLVIFSKKETKKISIFEGIVEFINWYNGNKEEKRD